MKISNHVLHYAAVIFLAFTMLAGCASTAQVIDENPDPLENYNRMMYRFNEGVDKTVIKPIAKGYKAITPEFVDIGISNFFSNLGDVSVVANDLLQLKFEQAVSDTGRLLVNSTIGVLGFFDVATSMGMPKHNEDFGQTLGFWGVGEGYYLVLPILGPSTTRDMWSVPVDLYLLHPAAYVNPVWQSYTIYGVGFVDARADFLRIEKAFDDAALDPYSFQREAYLQRRRNLVFDGNPPRPNFDDFDDPETESETPSEPVPDG